MSGSPRTKTKKGRVNSAYAELDKIRDPPGEEYENWVRLSKDKLKERECNLMSLRLSSLQKAINEQCQVFMEKNSVTLSCSEMVIGDEIPTQCLNTLYPILASWNGINLMKTKKSLDSFRGYFMIAKGWFDQKKKNMLGPNLWIPIFRALHQLTINAASNYFHGHFGADHDAQRLYAQHLLFQIMCGVLEAQITFAERKQPLIPIVLFKESKAIQQYLVQIHSALDIRRFVEGQTTGNGTAKAIYQFLKDAVNDLTASSHREFQCKLKAGNTDHGVTLNDGNINRTLNYHHHQVLGDWNGNIDHGAAECDGNRGSNYYDSSQCSECTQIPIGSYCASNNFNHSVATNQTLHNDRNSTIPPLPLMLPPLFVPPSTRTSGYVVDKPLTDPFTPILMPQIPISNDLNLNNNLFSHHNTYGASRSTVPSMDKSVAALRYDPMGHRMGECPSACGHCSGSIQSMNRGISVPSMHSTTFSSYGEMQCGESCCGCHYENDREFLDATCQLQY